MKVLILSSSLGSVNGADERSLLDLAANLRAQGHSVTCWGSSQAPGVRRIPALTRDDLEKLALHRLRDDSQLSSHPPAAGLHHWTLCTEEQLFGIAAAACLDEELQPSQPTVVYVKWQGGLVDAAGRSTALLEKLARANQDGRACTIIRVDRVYPPAIEPLAGCGFAFHSVAPWVTKQLAEIGVAADSVFELPDGVAGEPLRRARARRAQLRDEFGIPRSAIAILSVGAFDRESGNFPRVLRELAPFAKDPNIYWVTAGSRGKESTAWERQAKELFGERFRPIVGVLPERMPDLYGVADLAVCGSLGERPGMVYAETLLAGLPFVVHDSEITRWMAGDLPGQLAGVSRVDMQACGALNEAVGQWLVAMGNETGRGAIATVFENIRELHARRFSWESLGPRFAKAFRAAAEPEAVRARLRSCRARAASEAHARGVRLAQQGKAVEALRLLASALLCEETAERWNDLATCQMTCGHANEAEKSFRRAVQLDPNNAQALANFSVFLANRKRLADALPLIDRALAIPGEHQHALRGLRSLCAEAPAATPQPATTPAGAPIFENLPDGPLRILVAHETLPQTDCGGADVRLMQVLSALAAHGHAVTFVARLGLKRDRYTPPLEALGFTVHASDADHLKFLGVDAQSSWSFETVVQEGRFDVAILCEWFWTGTSIPEHYMDIIRRVSPRTRIAILSDDRHGLRELRKADLTKRLADIERGLDFQARETETYRRADIVLAITEEDRAGFLEITPDLATELLPMVAEKCAAGPGPAKRRHLLFLGSFSNLANLDGLDWYFARVWPLIRRRLPGAQMCLAGSSMPERVRALGDGIVGIGPVDDLGRAFAQYRVFISPIRYGTGIKTKNVAAMAHGIPVVTTTIGAEGMSLTGDEAAVSIADDEEAFAEAAVRLYQDDKLWRRQARAGREHILREFSRERLQMQVARFIDRVRNLQPKPYDPQHVPSYQRVERAFPEVLTHQPGPQRPGVRMVAYVHLGERLLAEGKPREALSQFRHAFHYLRGEVPNVSIFGRLLAGVERSYRELGDRESAERCARARASSSNDVREPVVEMENRGAGGEPAEALEAVSQPTVPSPENLSEALR